MYMKTIEELEAQLTAISEQIKELKNKPKFEVGKWYYVRHKSPSRDFVKEGALICYQGNNYKQEHYGFNYVGSFTITFGNAWQESLETTLVIEATPEEVKAALVKEAEKRGYEKGVEIKSFISGKTRIGCRDKGIWEYDSDENILDADGAWIFKQGQWATIIKDDVIKVGGYTVEKDDNEFGYGFKIGCKKVYEIELRMIRDLMERGHFKKVSFDGIETDLETINKILSL